MDNEIWIERAILLLTLHFRGLAPSGQSPIRTTSQTTEPAWGKDDLGRPTRATLEVELCGSRGEDGCGDDNTGDADKLVHGVRGQIAELL